MFSDQSMSLVPKILSMAGPAGKWIYEHYIDQTKIDLGFEQASAWKLPAIPVFKTRENGGRFKFSISTLSKHEIEICCLEIMFKSPFQLLNPGNDGFFKVEATNSDRFPFMLKWEGKKKVDQHTKIIFGIDANFPDHLDSHQVEIRVHAKRKNFGFGRFLSEGRTQVTIARQAFQLTSIPVQGIQLKPLEKFNVVQPFLAQQAWAGEGGSGGQLKFGVHEVYVDGSTSSRTVIGPSSSEP